MNETAQEIPCQNCQSPLWIKHVFYFELTTPDAWDALTSFAAGAHTPHVCPECAHENSTALPVSAYDPQLNRMYHYMPASSIAAMDLTDMFDFEADASSSLQGAVLAHLGSTGAFASGVLKHGAGQASFCFRVFFSLLEVIQQAFVGARVVEAHQAKAQRYRTIEPPAEFLERGSRLYKRNKLRFIYCLGQGFKPGRTYKEGDVDRVILHERRYLRQSPVDGTHARVALVELGILERTSCGSLYWHKPEPAKILGLDFPCRVEGLEKCGYHFYDGPNLGFSVNYRSNALERGVSFYVYGAPDLEISAEAIETEFSAVRDGMLATFECGGQTAEVLQEKRLTLDKHNGRAETVCHLTLRITDPDPDSTICRSHLLLTSWRGRFIKVRMTSPDAVGDDDEVLWRVVAALLKKIANSVAPSVSVGD